MSKDLTCKYAFAPNKSEVTFRPSAGAKPVTINKNNISDSLVELAIKAGKEHCFIDLSANGNGQKKSQLNTQLQPVSLALNEVPTEDSDSLEAQPNKREAASLEQPKKKGRKPNNAK